MKYLTEKEIKQAFAEHLMKHRKYTAEEAEIAVSDFPDPYSNCYLEERYIGSCEVDGVAYKQYASNTDLWRIGIHKVPNFFFYTYYKEEDVEGGTVGDYMKAQKIFRVDELDEEDFPLLQYEKNAK